MIDSPAHYKDTKLMDYLISHNVGFAEGNICKYVVRWKEKDGLRDLKKARDYLSALIAYVELNESGYDELQLYKDSETTQTHVRGL